MTPTWTSSSNWLSDTGGLVSAGELNNPVTMTLIIATKGQFEDEHIVGVFHSIEMACKALSCNIEDFTYYPARDDTEFSHYRTADLRPDGYFNYDQIVLDVVELNKYYP